MTTDDHPILDPGIAVVAVETWPEGVGRYCSCGRRFAERCVEMRVPTALGKLGVTMCGDCASTLSRAFAQAAKVASSANPVEAANEKAREMIRDTERMRQKAEDEVEVRIVCADPIYPSDVKNFLAYRFKERYGYDPRASAPQ